MQSRISGANRRNNLVVSVLLLGMVCTSSAYSQGAKLDLSNAVIVHSAAQPRHAKAAELLQFEVQKRTGISLAAGTSMPSDGSPAIVVGTVATFPTSYTLPAGLSVPAKAEGYAVWIDRAVRPAPTVYLVGRDDRGALFAVCRLIRLLYLAPKHIHLADDIRIATAPDCPVRAHQIIRSTQCEDGFVDWRNATQEQQYARDLILFGTNGFEARTPRDIDDYLEELGIDLYFKITCQGLIDHDKLSDEQ
ncbi:MAG: beta-N-acetylhexosaminidase family protein, partial [Planctomycetota bacterium]